VDVKKAVPKNSTTLTDRRRRETDHQRRRSDPLGADGRARFHELATSQIPQSPQSLHALGPIAAPSRRAGAGAGAGAGSGISPPLNRMVLGSTHPYPTRHSSHDLGLVTLFLYRFFGLLFVCTCLFIYFPYYDCDRFFYIYSLPSLCVRVVVCLFVLFWVPNSSFGSHRAALENYLQSPELSSMASPDLYSPDGAYMLSPSKSLGHFGSAFGRRQSPQNILSSLSSLNLSDSSASSSYHGYDINVSDVSSTHSSMEQMRYSPAISKAPRHSSSDMSSMAILEEDPIPSGYPDVEIDSRFEVAARFYESSSIHQGPPSFTSSSAPFLRQTMVTPIPSHSSHHDAMSSFRSSFGSSFNPSSVAVNQLLDFDPMA
jgi:hypothetical protein